MPLFFKLWFAFVAILVASIFGGVIYVFVSVGSDPAVIGRIAGEMVSGFKEVTEKHAPLD